jgi:hypothetical protein
MYEWWYGVVTNTFQGLDFARWQRQHLNAPVLQYVSVCAVGAGEADSTVVSAAGVFFSELILVKASQNWI